MRGLRKKLAIAASLFVTLTVPANAWPQAVIFPGTSDAGAYEKYVLRLPNGRDVATTRVEIRFPHSVRVISFGDVPGWSLEIVTDTARHITGAIWTGSLAPQRFVELPFVAVNPKKSLKLIWPVFQTYSSGERIDWTGHDDAKQPAPATVVAAAPRSSSGALLALWVCIGALVLSLAALVIALRPERPPRGFQPGS